MSDNGKDQALPSIADDPLSDVEKAAKVAADTQAQLNALAPVVKIAVTVMVQGLRVATPNIDVAVLIHAIAEQCGESLMSGINADVNLQLMLRKGLQEAFGNGIRKVPVMRSLVVPGSPGADHFKS